MNKHKIFFISILLFIAFFFISNVLIYSVIYKDEVNYVPDDVDTLIMGASHCARDLSDKIINNSINLGVAGEPLFFTYGKIKKIIDSNNNIKNIFITVQPATFSKHRESRAFSNTYMNKAILDYFFFVSDDSIKQVLSSHNKCEELEKLIKFKFNIPIIPPTTEEYTLFIRKVFHKLEYSDYRAIGEYLDLNIKFSPDQEIQHVINRHYGCDNKDLMSSELLLWSFKRIIELCNLNDINLYIIRTPEKEDYRALIPHRAITDFNEIVSLLEGDNICYFDFSNLEIENRLFFDGDHLNSKGAEYFSSLINEQVLDK